MTTQELLTVRELADLFHISRQAMRKHVDNLPTTYLAKNAQGYKAVTLEGALFLADKLDNPELSVRFQQRQPKTKETFTTKEKEVVSPLLHTLSEQLEKKDNQIAELQTLLTKQQKLFDQQQQLTLQANQQITHLQSKIARLEAPESVSGDSIEREKANSSQRSETPVQAKEKKWWHFW